MKRSKWMSQEMKCSSVSNTNMSASSECEGPASVNYQSRILNASRVKQVIDIVSWRSSECLPRIPIVCGPDVSNVVEGHAISAERY